jgi:hypothetical protein
MSNNLNLVEIKNMNLRSQISSTAPMTIGLGAFGASDINPLVLSVRVASVSAGIAVGNEATIEVEQSWDDGTTWSNVSNVQVTDSTGGVVAGVHSAGTYVVKSTSSSGPLSPILRTVITPPSSQTMQLVSMWKRTVGS